MKADTYAVAMACPHATSPTVLWDINTPDDGGADAQLWVPRLETWTLDTLRMVLHELAAYLPPHDEAMVTIHAKTDKPKGRPRPDGIPHPPRFNDRVVFELVARGWTVNVLAYRNERLDAQGKLVNVWDTGSWTDPMQAVLLDLAAKSPFPLSRVRPVDSLTSVNPPSRRDVLRGVKPSRRESRRAEAVRLVLEQLDELDDDEAA